MLDGLSPPPPVHDDKNHIHEENLVDDQNSLGSHRDIQRGVKNIEAISQTWTQWSLISAYIG